MQFESHPLFEQAPVETEYRKLDIDGVSTETFHRVKILEWRLSWVKKDNRVMTKGNDFFKNI